MTSSTLIKIAFSTLLLTLSSSISLGKEISGEYYDWTKTMQPEQAWLRDYQKTVVSKLFLCKRSGTGEIEQVFQTFEQALETIKKYDNATLGVPKIIYLVGWQFTGHDSGYPSFAQVNEALKRPQDQKAADSLRWLIQEAKKYNTTVSLHINMFDAFKNSPLWETYEKEDIIAKDKEGNPIPGEIFDGMQSYQISYAQEWNTGHTTKRIDQLLTMLPELIDGGTIHVDAFHSIRPVAPKDTCISPYLKYTLDDEVNAQRKIFRYFRSKGLDVTSEGFLYWLRKDPFIGLQPLTWNTRESELDASWEKKPKDFQRLPEYLAGRTPLRLEQEIRSNPEDFNPIIQQFSYNVVKWYFLNNGYSTYDCDISLSENEVICPISWKKETLLAISKSGFDQKAIKLPSVWKVGESVKINHITPDGLKEIGTLPINDHKITLTSKPNEPIVITLP